MSNKTPPIRFGLQVAPSSDEIDSVAQQAEQAGFDVLSVADHIGPNVAPPLPMMNRLLAATESIKVGSLVLNNDMRNPVQLAWEIAWLQNAGSGRVELGLGAGHTPHEYAGTGITFDHPRVRKARLAEAAEILSELLSGRPDSEALDFEGEHYQLSGAQVAAVATKVPILIGGNGTSLLTHAAQHADIIGLQGLGRTMEDGHRHSVKFSIDHLESQLATIAEAAEARPNGTVPELNALVQMAEITEDREQALAAVVERAGDLTMDAALATPYLATGTVDELAQQFLDCRNRWGISYFTVRNPEWGPVIARVRELTGRLEPE